MALDILIVDDERDIRELVAGVLSDEGYDCRTAGDSVTALAAIDERRPSLVLLDVWLHGSPMDGLEILDAIKAREPGVPVIIFSGHGNIDTAVSAIGRGAADFIEKPFEAERLLHLVARATETERLRRENAQLRQGFPGGDEFTGNSALINQVRATLKRIASTGSRLLISGPAGSGKEVAARLLHGWSLRADNAFVCVNSARITPDRFEHELFGEEADGNLVRPGLLEMADGGTLYFDEVADMPLSTQARILRVLTDQAFVRVGGSRQIRVDVRVVSSTSRELGREIAEGRFREDLFYRLAVAQLCMPPLRDRPEDIAPIAYHLLQELTDLSGQDVIRIDDTAMHALEAYRWPGNVRELRNALEVAMIGADNRRIRLRDLPAGVTAGGALPPRPADERARLIEVLARTGGNKSLAAQALQCSRMTLYRKLARYGLNDEPDASRNGVTSGSELSPGLSHRL